MFIWFIEQDLFPYWDIALLYAGVHFSPYVNNVYDCSIFIESPFLSSVSVCVSSLYPLF